MLTAQMNQAYEQAKKDNITRQIAIDMKAK